MSLCDPALQYFLTAFETGSVNAAARRLYVASSAVSRQIARLEREAGAQLFERLPSGIVATDAGHAFAGYARRAIQDAADIADEVHKRQTTGAVINLAATDGTAHDFLPRVTAMFRAEHPDARFVLDVSEPNAVPGLVRDGVVDLGITFSLTLTDGVTILYSQEAPLRAVMRRGHPLATTSRLSLRELMAYPLALSSPGTTNRFLVESCAASYRLPVEPVFVCHNPDGLMRYVEQSDAVTFLGHITSERQSEGRGLVTVPLREKEFGQRTLQIQCRAGRSLPPALSGFTDLLVEELGRSSV